MYMYINPHSYERNFFFCILSYHFQSKYNFHISFGYRYIFGTILNIQIHTLSLKNTYEKTNR